MVENYREFVAYMTEVPTIEISGGVAVVKDRSGNIRISRAMSIRNLERYRERVERALSRVANGDTDIVVDD